MNILVVIFGVVIKVIFIVTLFVDCVVVTNDFVIAVFYPFGDLVPAAHA
jgi:hypothetical protein